MYVKFGQAGFGSSWGIEPLNLYKIHIISYN